MAYRLGLDLGSTTSKAVVLDAGDRIVASALRDSGHDLKAAAEYLQQEAARLVGAPSDLPCVATGYGRGLAPRAKRAVTEITCQARGVFFLHPDAATIVDMGGQDAKVIRLGVGGQVEEFAMNDRCAAGAGAFLDLVARRFQRSREEMSCLPPVAEVPEISATCAVFAETEIVGLIASGHAAEAVLVGVHRALARRVAALCRQVRLAPPVYFAGGVALNETMRRELAAALGLPVLRAAHAQLTAAIGAALLAGET
ncbi:MAG: acyl-CoA dehydratase activase [Planctomycetota bacterium]|nr:acyl-CoA dehydratase activase [Planctomycetota bacterium]